MAGVNKKIRGATSVVEDNIEFRSKLEARLYAVLKENGFSPGYECMTFNICEGFYPKLPCYDVHYDRKLKRKIFGINTSKVQAITYTPDFTILLGNTLVIIEAKGRENDVFPYKKKLFRKWAEGYCEMTGMRIVYFEIFNKAQMLDAIEIMKHLNDQSA